MVLQRVFLYGLLRYGVGLGRRPYGLVIFDARSAALPDPYNYIIINYKYILLKITRKNRESKNFVNKRYLS